MGLNEQKILRGFFADILEMHDINDVTAAMSAAIDASAAKAPTDETPSEDEIYEAEKVEPVVGNATETAPASKKLTPLESLEKCYGLKMVPFRTGTLKKLVGRRRASGGNRDGDHIFEVEIKDNCRVTVLKDGEPMAEVNLHHCLKNAERIGIYIVRSIIKENRRRLDMRKRNRARKAAVNG